MVLKRLQCMQKTAPVTRWMKIVTNRTSKRNKLMTIESIHYLESILMGILPFKIPSFIPPMKYIYYILKGLIYYTSSLLFISSKLFWRIAQLIYTAIWRKEINLQYIILSYPSSISGLLVPSTLVFWSPICFEPMSTSDHSCTSLSRGLSEQLKPPEIIRKYLIFSLMIKLVSMLVITNWTVWR